MCRKSDARLRVDTHPQSGIINGEERNERKDLTMFDYIAKNFYGAAANGAETGKVSPAQAREIVGMVRLALACNDSAYTTAYILVERLRHNAYQQWRVSNQPNANFEKALESLASFVLRHA